METRPSLEVKVREALERLRGADRLRRLIVQDGASGTLAIDLTHNDYLGLRDDASFQARAHRAAARLPVGAGASRLLGGEHPIFQQLEGEFAQFKGAASALFFTSGYAANEAVATSLARLPGVAFFSDALNHASIIDGIRLSGLPKDVRHIYPHNDCAALEQALRASRADVNVIFAETIFSMDGDCAPLAEVGKLAERYRGILVLDEAHAILCAGPGGRGLAAGLGIDTSQLITINTCGKAMAASGALVCGPAWFREHLINVARTFIFTTGPSPWIAAALLEVTRMAPELEQKRLYLARISEQLRTALSELGYQTSRSSTHIVPVLCGTDRSALALAEALRSHGIRVKPIRPPTVPEGTSRLRLSLHAGLTDGQIDAIIAAFRACRDDQAS